MIILSKRNVYALAATFAVAGLSACSGGIGKKDEANDEAIAVTLATVAVGTQPVILASGNIEPVQTANISTRVMGRITKILVKTGDRVKKGQLLATVWDEDIKAKRAQVEAMVAEAEGARFTAEKDFDRFNNLYQQQSATAKELENVTLQYNSAKARLVAAREMRSEVDANLSYSRLTAPFAGVVTQKVAETGSIASPGQPVVTIENDEVLQVSASIAESDIVNIHLGDTAIIQIRSTDKRLVGKVAQLNPSSQFTGSQYIVKISIPQTARKDIYVGMFASLSIPVKDGLSAANDVILVPNSAIVNRDELTGIYTISAGNRALLRWVRLGKSYGDKVEVISGLSREEKFILSSEGQLHNGTRVKVKEVQGLSLAGSH
jgi:RND family efflux transporter MFP subunit